MSTIYRTHVQIYDILYYLFNGADIWEELTDLLSMEPWAAAKKKLSVSVAMPPAPVRDPSQRPLAPSVVSRRLLMIRAIMK